MILSQQEFQDFQKIYGELLFHTGQKFFKSSQSKENFFDLAKPELKIEIRDKLFKEDYISEIIKTNPFHFPDSYIEILKEWREHFIVGEFILIKFLKKYAVFRAEKTNRNDLRAHLFGVYGLRDEIDYLMGNQPRIVNTILLPFAGKITYDGVISSYNIFLGAGIKKSFLEEYTRNKANFGIIESLPHNRKANKEAQMDLLTTYLKTEKNRQQYWDEIWEIIGNDEELLTLYYQLSGKLYSKRIQKSLKNININPAYYAVYESTVVGVASKKIDLEERIKEVVPSDKLKYVYIFRK